MLDKDDKDSILIILYLYELLLLAPNFDKIYSDCFCLFLFAISFFFSCCGLYHFFSLSHSSRYTKMSRIHTIFRLLKLNNLFQHHLPEIPLRRLSKVEFFLFEMQLFISSDKKSRLQNHSCFCFHPSGLLVVSCHITFTLSNFISGVG